MSMTRERNQAHSARPSTARPLRVLHLTSWLSNRGGGIPVAVAGICTAMARQKNIDVSVVGLVESESDVHDQSWGKAGVHPVTPREKKLICYAPDIDARLTELAPDIVHVHGLWTYSSIAAMRWGEAAKGRRVFVSPHGMLERWALQNSHWKKAIAGALFQKRALRGAACLHALSPAEKDEIFAYGVTAPVAVIPNGVALPAAADENTADVIPGVPEGKKTLLYLGRIHPKKNLPLLLSSWAAAGRVKDQWHIVIAGWDQDGHQGELEAQARTLGIAEDITFAGPQFGPAKDRIMKAADAFILPSLSEGVPMVVLEAWSHRLPVIMSEACNLDIGFERGAAQRMHLDAETARIDLERFLGRQRDDLSAMGLAGFKLVESTYSWSEVARKMRQSYDWSLGTAPAGEFIHER